MDMNQFTQKTIGALQRAQSLAIEYQHMQVEQEHLLLALTEDENELIPQLLTRCGISVPAFVAGLKSNLDHIARVSGSGREPGKVYIAGDVEQGYAAVEAVIVRYGYLRAGSYRSAVEQYIYFSVVQKLYFCGIDRSVDKLSVYRTDIYARPFFKRKLAAVKYVCFDRTAHCSGIIQYDPAARCAQ